MTVVEWRDLVGRERFSNSVGSPSHGEIARVADRAINHTGCEVHTQVNRPLTKQTELKAKVIRRALRVTAATPSRAELRIESTGGDVVLKFFRPREFRGGVKASLVGKRQLFAGTFLIGERFPGRVPLPSLGDHVMRRTGAGRTPIELVKSGVIIPAAMVKGASLAAFDWATEDLPERFAQEAGFSRDLQIFTGGTRF